MPIAQALLWIATACVAADAPPEEPAVRTVDFYLSGMLAQRQRIRSGDFVVMGMKSSKDSTRPEFDYSGKLLISCQFDETRVRMDNLEPGMVPTPTKIKPGRIARKYIRTPDQSVTWLDPEAQNKIVISIPETVFGSFLFFDVRGLGLTKCHPLTSQHGWTAHATIAALKRSLREKSVDTSDPKYVQLVFALELATRSEELRYWLRPDQGFAPVRLETKTRQLDSPDQDWHVNEHSETAWEQIDGVWLPVRFEVTQNEKTVEQRLAWKIRWRSVNKPIDDSRFGWKDFGAPESTEVLNGVAGGQKVR
ncbi:MAG TPA: hypothetical protein VHY91_27310 [Pirellulales bacterium]|nr:hypothetical protein [Pirellulales bacterium]